MGKYWSWSPEYKAKQVERLRKVAKRKCDPEKVVEDFKKILHLQRTGDLHGITRERVRQIVKQYAPDFLRELQSKCKVCDRSAESVHVDRHGYCSRCLYLKNTQGKVKRRMVISVFCKKCRVRLESSRDYKNYSHVRGGRGMCRRCYQKYYIVKTPGFKKAQKKYFSKNRKQLYIKNREYYQKNKEVLRAKSRAYHARPEVKERIRALQKEYYLKNKEKLAAQHKAWRDKNREKLRAKSRERYRKKKSLSNSGPVHLLLK